MHSFFVPLKRGGSSWWHQKHLTRFSTPASDLSFAAAKCAPVNSQPG